MGWADEIDVRINKIFCDSEKRKISTISFFPPCGQWFSFSHFADFLGPNPCSTGTRLFYFMVSQVLFPELCNASVHLVAAVVHTLWSHKSKVGGCMREQQGFSINFCFAFLTGD